MRNERLKTTEGERWLPGYQGSRLSLTKARPTSARKRKKEKTGHCFTACAVHQTLPFFEKVGLACETADRGEERDGKQREIVEKTNTRG